MTQLTEDELIELFDRQLPALLERRPELAPRIYHAFLRAFATKEEIATVLAELRGFRAEVEQRFDRVEEQAREFREEVGQQFEQVDKRFEQVDKRFEQVDKRFDRVEQRLDRVEERMEAGFLDLHRAIDRLGARWGIRNESIFRQTMAQLLEESFGFRVEERMIQGEQFDCVIFDGQHILVEIAASVGPDIQKRLERKRRVYTEATGIAPARVILVTVAIHSHRAQLLREAGFEVIEPEEDRLVG